MSKKPDGAKAAFSSKVAAVVDLVLLVFDLLPALLAVEKVARHLKDASQRNFMKTLSFSLSLHIYTYIYIYILCSLVRSIFYLCPPRSLSVSLSLSQAPA